MSGNWKSLEADLSDVLATIQLGQFVIVEYDAGLTVQPYAQAASEPDGYYCEVVSECFLPRDYWPILVSTLERSGWQGPGAPEENWWCSTDENAPETAALLLAGLRDGRVCRDPSRFTWHVGTFPPGPGGGEPVPVPIASQLRAA